MKNIVCIKNDNNIIMVGLSADAKLYMENRLITNDCSSFIINNKFIIFTQIN